VKIYCDRMRDGERWTGSDGIESYKTVHGWQ
jgi:hypothetical protein